MSDRFDKMAAEWDDKRFMGEIRRDGLKASVASLLRIVATDAYQRGALDGARAALIGEWSNLTAPHVEAEARRIVAGLEQRT